MSENIQDELHQHDHEHDGIHHRHAHFHPSGHATTSAEEEHEHAPHNHTHSHEFEIYAFTESPIHRLDARTKTLSFLALIVFMVVTPVSDFWCFELYLALLASLYVLAGVPLGFGLKRSVIVIPFVLFAGILLIFMPDKPHPSTYDLGFIKYPVYHGGLYILLNALLKSWLSTLTVILLYSTTPFPKFIRGLEMLHAPIIITSLFSFLYRFMAVITGEVKSMLRARDSRAFGGSRLWHLKTAGQMVGSLFIRSYERAERIYSAMVSRGYDGTIISFDVPVFGWRDSAFTVVFFAILSVLFILRIR